MPTVGDSRPNADRKQTSSKDPKVKTPASNADTKCENGNCKRLIREDDRFCRYCGYSRKKCAACGKKLPTAADNGGKAWSSAGKFCPSCGAARSGQQVIKTSPTSSRARGIGSFVKNLAAPVAVAIIAYLIITQPTVSTSTAQNFLNDYFNGVTASGQRSQVYVQDLTTNFRKRLSYSQYNAYWETIESVKVDSVDSIPGNPFEFTVSFEICPKSDAGYCPKPGNIQPIIVVNFWIACIGFFGNLAAKFPWEGCPIHDLKIDNEQDAPLTNVPGRSS